MEESKETQMLTKEEVWEVYEEAKDVIATLFGMGYLVGSHRCHRCC